MGGGFGGVWSLSAREPPTPTPPPTKTMRKQAMMGHRGPLAAASSTFWHESQRRLARHLDSVVLPGNESQDLLSDARRFLARQQWYADRGIPWRRGYLLHGVPGGGKTSLIGALAGELNARIFWLSLSTPGMNDALLNNREWGGGAAFWERATADPPPPPHSQC